MDQLTHDFAPFSMCPEGLTLDPRVGDRAVRLWNLLSRIAWRGDTAFPPRRVLAELLNCAINSLDRALAELVEAGWLQKERSAPGAGNIYRLMSDSPSARPIRLPDLSPLVGVGSPTGGGTIPYRESLRSTTETHSESAFRKTHQVEQLPDEDAPAARAKPSRTHRAGSGAGLAARFETKARANLRTLGPDAFNGQLLAKAIRRWLDDGTTADEVRAMIDIFCTPSHRTQRGIPLWKAFLAQRERLHEKAQKVTLSQGDLDTIYALPPGRTEDDDVVDYGLPPARGD